MQPSPYTPGQVAREVVGRAEQLAEIGERLMYMTELGRLIGRIRVDTGPRGVGKTSLLREVQRAAEARGVVTVWVTAGGEEPLTAAIATQIRARTAGWKKKSRGRLLRAIDQVSITAGVPGVAQLGATVKPAQSAEGASPEPSFKELIVETVKAARDEGHRGLVLLIDEVQDADRQGLRTLAVTWQDLQAEADALPAGLFAAGLPQTPEIISAAATFSERFAYRTLHRLSRRIAGGAGQARRPGRGGLGAGRARGSHRADERISAHAAALRGRRVGTRRVSGSGRPDRDARCRARRPTGRRGYGRTLSRALEQRDPGAAALHDGDGAVIDRRSGVQPVRYRGRVGP